MKEASKMFKFLLISFTLIFLFWRCGTARNNNNNIIKPAAVKIILDSDIGQDCDDAGVMAMMHKLADNGEAEIVATMFPMPDPMGAPAMDVINTYYGRPDIPIDTYNFDDFLLSSNGSF